MRHLISVCSRTLTMAAEQNPLTLDVAPSDIGIRLDRFLASTIPDISRSYAQQLIADAHVHVNGRAVKASTQVAAEDVITVMLPPPTTIDLVPEAIPLTIRYEDADVVVVDKPAGMVVHPAPGHTTGTLVHALLYHYPEMEISGDLRPGIIHRLDRDTTGLLVVAKNDRAKTHLQAQQQARTMTKLYLALINGHFSEPEGSIEAPIDRHPTDRLRMAVVQTGRPSRTGYREIERLGDYSLVEARLYTGRTHQIRVHFALRHHPVIGDSVYGTRRSSGLPGLQRQFLHAYRLGFKGLDGQQIDIESPLPPDLQGVLDHLRERYSAAQAPYDMDAEQPWWET